MRPHVRDAHEGLINIGSPAGTDEGLSFIGKRQDAHTQKASDMYKETNGPTFRIGLEVIAIAELGISRLQLFNTKIGIERQFATDS